MLIIKVLQICGKKNCFMILGLALICVVCLLSIKQSIWPLAGRSLLCLRRPCHPELSYCGWKYVSCSHILLVQLDTISRYTILSGVLFTQEFLDFTWLIYFLFYFSFTFTFQF
jgi:hypothetical protein